MSTWVTLADITRRLNVPESEILFRRAIGGIGYSEKTDKYDMESILQTRTMTIGLDKYLNEAEKAFILTKMEDFTKLYMRIFKKMQNGVKFESSGKDREHRLMAKELSLQQIFADSAMAMASGLYQSSATWKLKYEEDLRNEIKELEEKINDKENFKKGLKRVLKRKQFLLEQSLALPYKKIWFGNKDLSNLSLYRKSRLSLFVAGTAGKGNLKYGIIQGSNGYDLRLDTKIIKDIKIPSSNLDTFSLNGINRQASRISFNKKGKLVLNITYSYITPIKVDDCKSQGLGTIGIDIGPKEIAVCFVKKDGNPLKYTHYNLGGMLDARKDEKVRLLSEILEKILDEGASLGFYHVTIENLDNMRFFDTGNRKLNRMLSKFPRGVFKDLMISKCARKGFKLKRVHPAYTSIIGLYKFSSRDNLTLAHNGNSKDLSAALAIGRRGLGLKEREVVCFRKLGKSVAFTAASLFLPAEHGINKGRDSNTKSNFWYKIGVLIKEFQTQTGIPRFKGRTLYSTPTSSELADFLEMRTRRCHNSALASSVFDWDAPENILPF